MWLMGVVCVISFSPLVPQDYAPFISAAVLVREGHPEDVYLPPDAENLFDTRPGFQAVSARVLNAVQPTAYVSPPPAVGLGWPSLWVPVQVAMIGFRLSMNLLVFIGVWWLDRQIWQKDAVRGRQWSLLLLGMTPLFVYSTLLGQTSGLLIMVGAAGVLAPQTARDLLAGVALSIVTIAKLLPLALIAGALAMRRRPLGLSALLAGLLVTVLSLLWLPLELWASFFTSLQTLGGTVIADRNNASADALLAHLQVGGVGAQLVTPTAWAWWMSNGIRIGLVGAGLWLAYGRTPASPARRFGALLLVFLALTPLLWVHYLQVLLPILWVELYESRSARTGWVFVALGWGLSIPIILRLSGVDEAIIQIVATATWLTAAGGVLMHGLRPPQLSEENHHVD
ncbi:MAG: glycosyltransferase family 87 protein [Myxococcota bacterium]